MSRDEDSALAEMEQELLKLRGEERTLRELAFHINHQRDLVQQNIQGISRERQRLIDSNNKSAIPENFYKNTL